MINFIGLNFLKTDESSLREWIRRIASFEENRIERIDYNFVSEAKMIKINKEFLKHDTLTDVITFDYTKEKIISAEVFVSKKALRENAGDHSQTLENEMLRLFSHAVLHCLGYKDKTKEEKQKMRKKETDCIKMFHVKQESNV